MLIKYASLLHAFKVVVLSLMIVKTLVMFVHQQLILFVVVICRVAGLKSRR